MALTTGNRCACGCGAVVRNIYAKGHHSRKGAEVSFWEKADKRGPDECWEWQGSRDECGYGHLAGQVDGIKWSKRSHRLSYELHNGPIPEGMCVCHTCDNPGCVNPAHLWLGTHADNAHDKISKGREYVPRGTGNGRSKLTWDDVENIRANRMNISQEKLGEMFGVSQSTISSIQRRTLWA